MLGCLLDAEYPNLARALGEPFADGGYAFTDEFDYGLDLILDGFAERVERLS